MMDTITVFIILVVIFMIAFKIYWKLTTRYCKSNVCLLGKTAIVTGANTGIGYETASDFAKRGAKVILACRFPNRGSTAAEKIIRKTNNANVFFKHMDLASFKSIRIFAEEISRFEERLDILVNNAGAGVLGKKKSEDDNLLLMQTNYLGHFLLTNLLLDLLKRTPNSRIVNVASFAGKYFPFGFDLDNINAFPKIPYLWLDEVIIYGRTKLCNILFTIELAHKLKGTTITTYSLHPGLIRTEYTRTLPPGIKFICEMATEYFMHSPMDGAQTSIYCSVAKGIEHLSGEHFHDCQVVNRYRTADNLDISRKLWIISEKLVGLNEIK